MHVGIYFHIKIKDNEIENEEVNIEIKTIFNI